MTKEEMMKMLDECISAANDAEASEKTFRKLMGGIIDCINVAENSRYLQVRSVMDLLDLCDLAIGERLEKLEGLYERMDALEHGTGLEKK